MDATAKRIAEAAERMRAELDAAVLRAVNALSPHAGWAGIADVAGVSRERVKGALDRLQEQGSLACAGGRGRRSNRRVGANA